MAQSDAELTPLVQRLVEKTDRLIAQVKALEETQKRARHIPERIRRHPLSSLGCALSLGFLLASLIQIMEKAGARKAQKPRE
ncbi:MAG: hypothetical protein D6819_03405 [Gammaproteobacteria bacterium]|nr:MAG: hypothetical protein D6819_03405 [Gammaproteobacteria bacterium]